MGGKKEGKGGQGGWEEEVGFPGFAQDKSCDVLLMNLNLFCAM